MAPKCFLETKNIKTSTIDSIFKFVAQGGTLFFAQAITDIRFAYLAGLKTTGDLDTDVTSKGIHFTTPFLPNLNGKTIKVPNWYLKNTIVEYILMPAACRVAADSMHRDIETALAGGRKHAFSLSRLGPLIVPPSTG